ncbi:MAG TPA: metal ABC transporter substrate-binding protein [Acidimicrobiales bacterium]
MGTALRIGALGLAAGAVVGCADGDAAASDGPTVVVTTSILGDIVGNVVAGAGVDVQVVMPPGADPHEFSPSTRQVEAMSEADLLVVNGADFEQGMQHVLDRIEEHGTRTFALADHVDLLPFGAEHRDEDEVEAHGHDHEDDPHVWTDPLRVAEAVPALVDAVREIEGVDVAAVEAAATSYVAALQQLDADIAATLAAIPEEDRVLVTNHEVFGYFADRYDLEVVGTVVPAGTTLAEPSSGAIEELAEVVEERGVRAVFAETTQSSRLAEALADSVGRDVEVVELYTESLGEPGSGAETYLDLMRTDAELVAGALAP